MSSLPAPRAPQSGDTRQAYPPSIGADPRLRAAVHEFTQRRKWRHLLALVVGVALVVFGAAVVAAHLIHKAQTITMPIGGGIASYAAGAAVFAWGAGAGMPRRVARWLPATLVLGVLAVLVLAVAGLFPSETQDITSRSGNPPGGPSYQPPSTQQPTRSGGQLAADLLTRDGVARLLGPHVVGPDSPGAWMLRTRSLAKWRAAGPLGSNVRARIADVASLQLIVHHTSRAATLRPGHGHASMPGLGEGGRARHVHTRYGYVSKIEAARGRWTVSLQLRTPNAADATAVLAPKVAEILTLLGSA